jgi:uncharacterized protein YjbJ (UPF0337 family)
MTTEASFKGNLLPTPSFPRHSRCGGVNLDEETTMGSTADKIKGMANEAAGNVKQGVGKALNKPGLQAKGMAQERKGEAQQAAGKAKDAVKKVIDKA